jgi:hypothetical protein
MEPIGRRVKIRQEEMDSLFNLKSLLDHIERMTSYAIKYQGLGWVLGALNAQDGADLKVDFAKSPEIWFNRLWEPDLSGSTINLGVNAGRQSGVLVLEVAKGRGESILDQYGDWRAECCAAWGAGREQHFYAWGPSPLFDAVSFLGTPDFRWFGEGQVVLVPPSVDPEIGETGEWLCPPWEKPPQSPSQSLVRFLQEHITREPSPAQSKPPFPWQEIYCLVSPHEPLLQALFASYPSMPEYYQGILAAAAAVGINAPEVLLSLLWHAPLGNAGQHSEKWEYLQKLVAPAQDQPAAVTSRGNASFELFLENSLALLRESPGGYSAQPADQPGPTCSLKRRLAKPLQTGGADRTPISCRLTRGDSRKVL